MAFKSLYASVGGMRQQLSKLQENDEEAKLFRDSARLLEGWEDVERVLQYQRLPYVPAIIRFEVINYHHDDLLAGHFGIDKTKELVGRKYYWPSLRRDVKSHVRGCDVCLTLKAVRYKPYRDLQSLPIPTHWWKYLSMDFMTGLPLPCTGKATTITWFLSLLTDWPRWCTTSQLKSSLMFQD